MRGQERWSQLSQNSLHAAHRVHMKQHSNNRAPSQPLPHPFPLPTHSHTKPTLIVTRPALAHDFSTPRVVLCPRRCCCRCFPPLTAAAFATVLRPAVGSPPASVCSMKRAKGRSREHCDTNATLPSTRKVAATANACGTGGDTRCVGPSHIGSTATWPRHRTWQPRAPREREGRVVNVEGRVWRWWTRRSWGKEG